MVIRWKERWTFLTDIEDIKLMEKRKVMEGKIGRRKRKTKRKRKKREEEEEKEKEKENEEEGKD